VLMLHGAADDWVLAAPCREYASRLTKAGKNVRYIEYPDAHHNFDSSMLKTPVKLPQAQTTRRCQLEEAANGQIINSQTKQPFTYSDPCVELGPTVAYNAQAHSEAQKAVRELVAAVLMPK